MPHVLDLQPQPASDTAHLADQALTALAHARGLHPDDPAVRLHLLVSIHQQLQADTLTAALTAALTAHHHGYTPLELAVLLNHA